MLLVLERCFVCQNGADSQSRLISMPGFVLLRRQMGLCEQLRRIEDPDIYAGQVLRLCNIIFSMSPVFSLFMTRHLSPNAPLARADVP